MYDYIYLYIYIYTYSIFACMHACIHACIRIYIHKYIHTYIYIYVSIYGFRKKKNYSHRGAVQNTEIKTIENIDALRHTYIRTCSLQRFHFYQKRIKFLLKS
jgi:hypothetical protein